MYIIKIDRNEYTEGSDKKIYWGYAIYSDDKCLKREVIRGRKRDTDTRIMDYMRCYIWGIEKVVGYFNVNAIESDKINIYLTNLSIVQWVTLGTANKIYRIIIDKFMSFLDELPHSEVRVCCASKDWSFRRELNESNIVRHRYKKLVDILKETEENNA